MQGTLQYLKHPQRKKIFFTYLKCREMQIETTTRYHLTSVRMAIIKKEHKQHRLVRMWRKENPCTLLLCLVAQLCKILCDTIDCNPPGSSVHGDSPGKSTGVGCHALLQGIFPTQGQNSGLQQCRQILYHLSHQGFFTV